MKDGEDIETEEILSAAGHHETVGPVAPLKIVEAIPWVDEIDGLRARARSNNWILTDEASRSIAAALTDLRKSFTSSSTARIKTACSELMDQISAMSCTQLDCAGHPPPPLTPEAHALLYFNIRLLRDVAQVP